jgi:two-component system chemotaxis response regulator CheY
MMFLVTDDSRTARNIIKSHISELDIGAYDVFEAEDDESTFEILRTRRVDFILLDWNLSTKMTGLDILKTIRKMEHIKDIPIIMVTSESDKCNVIEALKYGANGFVVKPIDKKSFEEAVRRNIK